MTKLISPSSARRVFGIAATVSAAALSFGLTVGATSVPESSVPPPDTEASRGTRCVVWLHGKGGTGVDRVVDGSGVVHLSPSGNDEAWGGRQWLYFPETRFLEAFDIVVDAVADCDAVIIDGFSNGGAFAAKLYCRGADLGGRLIRVIIDDPVPDHAVDDCEPAEGVAVTLYWTGALADTAAAGWDCTEQDWTCESGSTIGIERFAERLGTDIVPSEHTDHAWFVEAPALSDWHREEPQSSVP